MPPQHPLPPGPTPTSAAALAPPAAATHGDLPWTCAHTPSLRDHLQRLLAWPSLLLRSRDLLLTSIRRDLETRVRGTALGFLWMLVQPLLLFAVYAFLFTTLLGVRLGASDIPAAAMGVYMFSGTLVWAAFSDAISRASSCIVDQRHLVRCVRFPAQLLPVQVALSALVTFCIGVAAFLAFTTLTSVWPAPDLERLAWIPLLLLLQALLTGGLGLALASIHVLWRDTVPFLALALTVWMFATPIFWVASPELLPGIEPYLGWVEANPVYHLVQTWRVVLMGGEPGVAFPLGFASSLGQLALWSLGSFVLGSLVFFRLERHLADEV